jgi:hypothetical protein
MRFNISLGSDYRGVKQPCEGAVKENNKWFVEVNTLEELLVLCSKVGTDLVLSECNAPNDFWSLTIYDDYLE